MTVHFLISTVSKPVQSRQASRTTAFMLPAAASSMSGRTIGGNSFRMASNDRVSEGVFRERHVPVGLSVDYHPSCNVALTVEAGYFVWSRIDFVDNHGDHVRGFETDPAPFLSFGLTVRF